METPADAGFPDIGTDAVAMTLPANVTRFLFDMPSLNDALRVMGFDAYFALSEPFRIELEVVCENPLLRLDKLIAKSGLLVLFDENLPQYLHGEVVSAERGESGNRYTRYHLSLRPRLHFLSLRSNQRIFQNRSVPDIVRQVLDDAGINGLHADFRLTSQYPQREYCVQYLESDLDFIERVLQEEGIYYYFEHDLKGHTLVLGDRTASLPDIDGAKSIRFKERTGMTTSGDESVYELTEQCAVGAGKVTLRDYDFTHSRLRLEETSEQGKTAYLEQYSYPGKFRKAKDGKRYAELRLQAERALLHHIAGASDCPRLMAGYRFSLHDHPRKELNRESVLLKTCIQGRQPQSLGEGAKGEGSTFSVTFHALPAETEFRPRRMKQPPFIHGAQSAMVVGPPGEEIYTDEFGRVKVQFHWDREGRFNENSSCWMRVSQPMVGDRWGAMVLPRVGQEVIVRFLEGDPDQPVVAGTLYNGVNETPYPLPAQKAQTLFKSMSTPGGGGFNELRIDDKKGEEQIYVRGERDLDLFVQNDSREWIGQDCHSRAGNERRDQIGTDLHTTVKGNHFKQVGQGSSQAIGQSAQIKITGSHLEEAGQTISLKAGMELVIEAGFEVALRGGSGLVKLDMSGVTITGPMVMVNSGGSAASASPVVISEVASPEAADTGEMPGNVNLPGLPNKDLKASNSNRDSAISSEGGMPAVPVASSANSGFGGDDALSLSLDALPVVGTAKGIAELALGFDPVTGESIPRLISAAGIAASMVPIPGAKAAVRGASKASKMVKRGDGKLGKNPDRTGQKISEAGYLERIERLESIYGSPNVHSLEKHGAQTTGMKQYRRVQHKDYPNPTTGVPGNKTKTASKFLTNKDHYESLRSAILQRKANPEINDFDIIKDRNIGVNIKNLGSHKNRGPYSAQYTNTARVRFDPNTGKMFTAFPIPEKK